MSLRHHLAVIAATLFVVGCHRPPLRVTPHGPLVTVDMQTLGEYPSDVARVRLTDMTRGQVVWELKGQDDPQVGTFDLAVGDNPVVIQDSRHGSYVVIVPVGKQKFTLASGKPYVIEVRGDLNSPASKRQAEFTLR